jgi:hypothetical protein
VALLSSNLEKVALRSKNVGNHCGRPYSIDLQ